MRLVVFDMDGTLIDSEGFIAGKMHESFEAEGLTPPTLAQSRRIIGLSLPEAMQALSGREGAELDVLVARYRSLYHGEVGDGLRTEPLYPGAREAVLELSSQDLTLVGIATGKGMRGVDRVLKLHDFADCFSTLQTPDHNPSKPNPAMLHRAMDETGVGVERTVMIGDTSFDIEMAVAAGTKAIGVSWGYHEVDELRRAGAHVIVDDYAELLSAIDELVGIQDA